VKKVFVVANPEKPRVQNALGSLIPWLRGRGDLVGIETDTEYDLASVDADVILVLGGDGTLLSTARQLRGRPTPLMGVNFGRLGFLASFTPAEFPIYLDAFLRDGLLAKPREMLEVSVLPKDVAYEPQGVDRCLAGRRFAATALNDAVITAGPPFHMIELDIRPDSESGVSYNGDGIIISTASGSTAYNASAGGAILSPDVKAFCITPICPHSLSFRPIIVASHSTILLRALHVNPGTTLFCDGQTPTQLSAGEQIVCRRSQHEVLLIENPEARPWRSLTEKLNWAASPRYSDAP
jgi:NAD+ kinase